MCRFRVIVSPSNQQETAVAEERLARMSAGSQIKREKEKLSVEMTNPKLSGRGLLSVLGWAKDSFGFHPTLIPSVEIIHA